MKLFPRYGLCLAFFGLAMAGWAKADDIYRFSTSISIPGEGGWDYLSVDSTAHRLFVTHDTRVVVIDLIKNVVIGEIGGLQGAHGFALAPELDRGFASSGRDGLVIFTQLSDLKELRRVSAGKNPDAILFEPSEKQVYAFNGRSQSASVFDALSGELLATIPLDAKPEFSQADPKRHRVYVNLEDKNQIAAIDSRSHQVLVKWAIAPGESPSGLAFDEAHGRLFAGCENAQIEAIDTSSGQVVATIPAGVGIDACAFDPGTQFVFSSNGRDGTVTVAHEDSPNHYVVVQTLATEKSARTMQVDLTTHKIYLASARFEPAESGKRPRMIPGSMKILVYELAKSAL